MPSEPTCGGCRWWEPRTGNHPALDIPGKCSASNGGVRRVDAFDATQTYLDRMWTKATETCGEHAPKPDAGEKH
jgi:hypothetical protein